MPDDTAGGARDREPEAAGAHARARERLVSAPGASARCTAIPTPIAATSVAIVARLHVRSSTRDLAALPGHHERGGLDALLHEPDQRVVRRRRQPVTSA